ncbi:dihydroorotate dehydrogenase, partial [Coemansia sp. RSA 2671]
AGIHKYVSTPLMRQLDAEQAHQLAIGSMKYGVSPVDRSTDDSVLEIELWGKRVTNPIGVAAGFDKNGEAIDALFGLGFGSVEIGSITPEPQQGNARPRIFRVEDSDAVINRMGLPNCGVASAGDRLRSRFWRLLASQSKQQGESVATLSSTVNRSAVEGRLLGVNVGKSKSSADDSFDDYVTGVQKLGPYADYVVINVSCPNVTNMKANGDVEVLERTVAAVMKARNGMGGEYRPPVVLKIGPDNDLQQLRVIAQVALDHRVDGIIATNTTRQRPGVIGVKEEGGLSGAPLRDMALATTREMYRLTQGKMAIVGCGGIRTAEDALAFARAGASCVQVYSSMTVDGPGKAREIKDGVVRLLKGRKWADVVGEDARRNLPLAPATPTTARSSEQQHGLSALEEGVIQQHSSGYNVFEDDRVLRICDEAQATAVDAPDGVDTLGGEEAADGGSSGGHMAAAGRRWRLAQLVGGGRRRTGSSADMGHRRSNHGSASTYSSPAAGGGAASGSFDLRWQQKHRRKRMRWWKHSASASGSGSGMLAPAPSEKPAEAGPG